MLVYILNKHGKPLMLCKPRKARKLIEPIQCWLRDWRTAIPLRPTEVAVSLP